MESLGHYVIHFADDSFGIVNLDYINTIQELKNPFAQPFCYLLGLKSFSKDKKVNIAGQLQEVIKNFKVQRDNFFELILNSFQVFLHESFYFFQLLFFVH